VQKISAIRNEYESIIQRLSNPGNIPGREIASLTARKSELEEIVGLVDRVEKATNTVAELTRVLEHEEDTDLRTIAKQELPKAETDLKQLTDELHVLLLPRDPHAEKDVVVEIRAGAGGDEASLFARDLFVMYTRYAEERSWNVQLLHESRSDIGGYKEVVFELSGNGVYGELKYERGVHRVQRIPETEKSGRLHTSTASVAVLPKAESVDVEIKPEDINIDTYRAGGHGGQKVQKTDSAVRITHIPTGVVAQCQNERSQQQNKENALEVLRSRILADHIEKRQREASADRKTQIGTGDRSEKIRTYNIPQDRITDHRIKKTWHGVEQILNGNLADIVSALKTEEERRLLEAADDA
jgi:peptide chain release factor 1